MPNKTRENRREDFLKSYANLPLNARKEVILVLKNEESIEQPITWEVAYFEIRNNTPKSDEILEKLDKLGLI